MKIRTFLSLTLAIASIGVTDKAANANSKPKPQTIAYAQTYSLKELTYSELFDLEERFVDTVVYAMMDADPSLIEYLFDIDFVRVSSNGQFATVGWSYNDISSGTTLLELQGDYIAILAERNAHMPQYTIEVMGVPANAAAEIATN
ncbi:MAG: hypothetical protein AAFO84_11980 [Cyanobacteria bacterium J06598_1]